jgi:hypothetical protein
MQKPVTFFSHSSKDKHALAKLKDLFQMKTGGSIDVFLSSDGQSIPFGRNWVHSVEQSLSNAKLMVVFVTPNSLRSNWLHFESGYAYSKSIRVVPVGIGIDLTSAGAPLNLLQGFNITSEAGLNNLIAVANEVFNHAHAESFTIEDFHVITTSSRLSMNTTLGPHTNAIKEITIRVPKANLNGSTPTSAIKVLATTLEEETLEHAANEKDIRMQGMTLHAQEGNGPDEIRINLDPAVVDVAMPLADRLIKIIAPTGMSKIPVRISFFEGINAVQQHHSLTGRLFGAGVRISLGGELEFKSLSFSVANLVHRGAGIGQSRRAGAYVNFTTSGDSVCLADVRDLLDVLFDREVLSFVE